jgi:4-amino-4-deoxy-L-arabinose transferase-like glycosyltransferase
VFAFWIVLSVTMVLFFSFAGFWHRYYLCMLAPGIAGLAGPGVVQVVRAFREKRTWKRFLLPASLAATVAVEVFMSGITPA